MVETAVMQKEELKTRIQQIYEEILRANKTRVYTNMGNIQDELNKLRSANSGHIETERAILQLIEYSRERICSVCNSHIEVDCIEGWAINSPNGFL